jgi:hypothetical protein
VFLREFVSLANREGVDYNLIEAFDQPWKYADEGVAGANWGIWNAARIAKFPLNGGVVPYPDWRWYAILGAVCGAALFVVAGLRDIRLAMPAFVLGNGFAIACAGTLPMLYTKGLLLDAVVNLPLQAVFAVMVIRRAAVAFAGESLPRPMSGAETLAALRRFRLKLNYDSLGFIFLACAAMFQTLLVFDGRYRDAPLPVFIIPVIAAVLRFVTRDRVTALGWEEILAANVLAVGAIASTILEGSANLDFAVWSLAAIIMAAPILLVQEGVTKRRRIKR